MKDKNQKKITVEFGSIAKMQIADCKMYDSNGNEVEQPYCEKCGNAKSCLMGENAYMWVCEFCGEKT
jgi:hypothetical protein